VHTEYQQTLDYLYTRLPMFSRIGAAALKPDLGNTRALCSALGDPQQKFRSIHIAGTNGKGSTSHMLAAIFSEAGYKTGLYTSPHLVDFRERIRIDGAMVSEAFVTRFVREHSDLIAHISPSFFEITVAMAFAAFAEAGVDIAIIETGLGGRLDSTNVITPDLSIITNISLDHTDLLGGTIAGIAKEKAGIIKPGVPVLIGQFHKESYPVFRETAAALEAELFTAWEGFGEISRLAPESQAGRQRLHFRPAGGDAGFSLETDLGGAYQEYNIRTVLAAVGILAAKGWKISARTAAKALAHAGERTGLRGRWEVLQREPLVIADVAHNPAGISSCLAEWAQVIAARKHIVIGFVRDKDVPAALTQFPKDNIYHFCSADTPRALPAGELAAIAAGAGLQGTIHQSVAEAVIQARKQLRREDALLITGSFFIVGEALSACMPAPHAP
jgi:dihydrofolate synthase/folylpolyglutamate synthase